MRLPFLFFFLLLLTLQGHSQSLLGIQGGYNINDIYLGNREVITELDGSASFGLLYTYLPEGKKPGFRLSATRTAFTFTELGEDFSYRYITEGYDLHFLTHMYLKFNKTRLYVNAGPGMSLWTSPQSISTPSSSLPEFTESNLNSFYLHITGGGGISQQIGSVYVSIFSHFSFTTTKLYRFDSGFSNALITRIGMAVQVPLGSADN